MTLLDYILKRFFKFVNLATWTERHLTQRRSSGLRGRKANERKRAEFLTSSEVTAMIDVAEKLRDKAMIAVGSTVASGRANCLDWASKTFPSTISE